MKLRIRDVGRLVGKDLPDVNKKGVCPLKKHRRDDKTFRVFLSKSGSGDELYKCWSCDPPENAGNAVQLYARLLGIDEDDAYRRLRDLNFDLGGSSGPREAPKPTPLSGTPNELPLELDPTYVARLQADPHGPELVKLFAKRRGLDEALCLRHMLGMPRAVHGGAVGFVYRHAGAPCRIKVRGIEAKRFFCIPKREKSDTSGRRALAPLFVVDALTAAGPTSVAFVTEGEVDALSLGSVGLPNVVSLPDGSESAKTADFSPLIGFSTWVLSYDDDEPGRLAAEETKKRARRYGIDTIYVVWERTDPDGQVQRFKDANDARRAGMSREEFVEIVDRRLTERYGCRIAWQKSAA